MTNVLALFGVRRSPPRKPRRLNSFRPRVESLEGREMLSANALVSAPLGHALASAASIAPQAVANQAASLLPLTVNSVNITGITNNALQLIANATTASGLNVQIPLTLTNTTPNATTPILNLHVGAIHLDVLGLKVDTSDICLAITAQSGPGNLLGNLLGDVAHL